MSSTEKADAAVRDMIDRIERAREAKNMTPRALALAAGLSHATYYVARRRGKLAATTLLALADAVGLEISLSAPS